MSRLNEIANTHAAVAAKTSCLFALVQSDSAVEKNSVNTRIIAIFVPPDSSALNRTTTGAIRSATASMVTTRRANISIRRFEYKRTNESDVLFLSRGEINSRLRDVSYRSNGEWQSRLQTYACETATESAQHCFHSPIKPASILSVDQCDEILIFVYKLCLWSAQRSRMIDPVPYARVITMCCLLEGCHCPCAHDDII